MDNWEVTVTYLICYETCDHDEGTRSSLRLPIVCPCLVYNVITSVRVKKYMCVYWGGMLTGVLD